MIPTEKLTLNRPIASGEFGAVYRAQLSKDDGGVAFVAVKTVKDIKTKKHKDDARLTLMKKEGLSMRKLKHKNVMSLKVTFRENKIQSEKVFVKFDDRFWRP